MEAREDRFEKTTLHVFVGEENGSLTPVPELVEGGDRGAQRDRGRGRLQRRHAGRPRGLR